MGAKVSSGGSSKRGSYTTNGDMNIIPFIDILLVLLIIFMVAAPIPTADVKVDLPPPVNVPPPPNPKRPTVVSILDDKQGGYQIYVDTIWVTQLSQLDETVLSQVSINVPGSPNRLLEVVRVRADQTLPYGVVMDVMGRLQEANFQKVALVAESALDPSAMQ